MNESKTTAYPHEKMTFFLDLTPYRLQQGPLTKSSLNIVGKKKKKDPSNINIYMYIYICLCYIYMCVYIYIHTNLNTHLKEQYNKFFMK